MRIVKEDFLESKTFSISMFAEGAEIRGDELREGRVGE